MQTDSPTRTQSKRTRKRAKRLNPDLIAISTQADYLGRWADAQRACMKLSDWFFRWLPPLLWLRANVQALHTTIRDLEQQRVPMGLSLQHAELCLELLEAAIAQLGVAGKLVPHATMLANLPVLRGQVYMRLMRDVRSQVYFASGELFYLSDQSTIWAAWDGSGAPPGA
jgi:hypothetical protein